MEYRGFEFFTSPMYGEERSPSDKSKDGMKTYFCEIYRAEDEGLANLLDCFTLREGTDIPVNSEPELIRALQKYVDDHYNQLSGSLAPSPKKDYWETFLHKTDFDLLYQQKTALLQALEHKAPVPEEILNGLINFLDFIGDWAEQEGVFTYPFSVEQEQILDDIICQAEEDLNESGQSCYVLPNNRFFIKTSVEVGSEASMNLDQEIYNLKLYQNAGNGWKVRSTEYAAYNDFAALRQCCKKALEHYEALTQSVQKPLDQMIANAASRATPLSPDQRKGPSPEIT